VEIVFGSIDYPFQPTEICNCTRDAIKGIAEQLDATNQIAWENRLALDMTIAEKGGIFAMIGGQFCTFILKNTAPDGTIMKASHRFTTFANEYTENSGVGDTFNSLMEQWFGKWKNMRVSTFTSLIIILEVMTIVEGCIIPCKKGLIKRLRLH
jgi:hypothetical protein